MSQFVLGSVMPSSLPSLDIGAGYNSVHEALCYAPPERTTMIKVGGDDQAQRLRACGTWELRSQSQADILAAHLMDMLARVA
jgi:hypothetical protein